MFWVSVLFNEPKLLKWRADRRTDLRTRRFSALQRAEIAEIFLNRLFQRLSVGFSALQRAEIAEMERLLIALVSKARFSALQRAEIAEIRKTC